MIIPQNLPKKTKSKFKINLNKTKLKVIKIFERLAIRSILTSSDRDIKITKKSTQKDYQRNLLNWLAMNGNIFNYQEN